tara:strand:- start:42 stop:251 length:210 start_codon:yes stop_codon:yes gene_type:complete
MNVYIVRYEDADVEICSFYCNQRDAMRGRTRFKRKFGVMCSIEKKSIGRTKPDFINLVGKYNLEYRERK